MDKTSLVAPNIDAGKHLLSALERAGLAISIAAWLKLKDDAGWNLYVASPDVQKYGPTVVNRFIDRVGIAIGSDISIDEILATNTTNHFINRISLPFFASSIHSAGGVYRLEAGLLGDSEIENGFVYKVDRSVKPSKEAPRPNADALKRAKLAA
jgi:hypothetical protein